MTPALPYPILSNMGSFGNSPIKLITLMGFAWVACLLMGNASLVAQTVSPSSPRVLRISSDNTPAHFHVRTLARFAERISHALGPTLKVELYPQAQLFRDREALNAVHSGKVEMAAPGTWNIEPYLPDLGVFLLPLMYGRSAAENHVLSDGEVGKRITATLESTFDVVVPGLWLDLGHAHVFTLQKQITKLEDFRGLRVRVAGGKANELRIGYLGAHVFTIPWSELVERLRNRQMDGLLTTYETVRSAELWKEGVRFAFEDSEYFPMYIPIVQKTFWQNLNPGERAIFRNVWNAVALEQRQESSVVQQEAKTAFLRAGGKVFVPSPDETKRIRALLLSSQSDAVRQLRISPPIISLTEKELNP